jgi:quercetin dioxygenase-like cupin family protein
MNFFKNSDIHWNELGDGIRRKVVGHTPQLMSVIMEFDKGAVGTPHSHEIHGVSTGGIIPHLIKIRTILLTLRILE